MGHFTNVHLGLAASVPGVFAAIGAASMLGGFMRLTIATTVTLVELTGDLSLVLPGMLSISIARAVAAYLHKQSYDESTIASRGMAFLEDTWLAQLEHCRTSILEKQHEMLGTLANVEGIKFAADMMLKVPIVFTASSRAHISQLVSFTKRTADFVEETKANQRSLQVRLAGALNIHARSASSAPLVAPRARCSCAHVCASFAPTPNLTHAHCPHPARPHANVPLTYRHRAAFVGENRRCGFLRHRQGG